MPCEAPELSRDPQSRLTTRGQALGFRSTQVPPSTSLVRTSQSQTAPRLQRVTRRRGLLGSRAPLGLSVSLSLSHTHRHTHTHTLAALARARGTTRTSQTQNTRAHPTAGSVLYFLFLKATLAILAAPLCFGFQGPQSSATSLP